MATIDLSARDIDYIARVVATEVPYWIRQNSPQQYNAMVGAVVDTITNRLSTGRYGNTAADVLNERRAFSKITGPARLNPYGSVQNAPRAPSQVENVVKEHIARKQEGKPSDIGRALDYANPHFSDKSNLRSWVNPMIANGAVRLGVGNAVHYHGLAPGNTPAPFNIINTPQGYFPEAQPGLYGYNPNPTPTERPSPDRPDNRDYRGPSLDPYQLNAAPVGPVERAPLGNTVVPPSIAPSGNTASPINAAPVSPVQSGGPIADLTPSPPVDNQTLADAYRDMARGMDMMGVRGLDGRLGPQDPMEVGGKIEGDVNAPVEPVETAPRTEAPRTINDRQVAAVSPVPTRSVQTTTISPTPERTGLLSNLGDTLKGKGASIAGSVLGGAVAGPVGSIVGGLLGNAIRGNGSGQGLFSGGLLSGNDYATPTTGNRSTGPMAAFNPFNYRYTGHSNPLWNERRSQALSHWQTPSSNRSTNPGHLGTGLQAMAAVYSGTAPTGFTATSRSNPNVSAMSLHGMVAHTNTQHGWTAMVDPHTGVQMGTVYGKAAVYSPVDDTWSFQPMDEARMAAKRGLPTSLGPVGKQAKGLRSTDPNPAVTGKAQSKGPAAQMGLMSRGLMGPAQSIGPGKGSTGFGGLGTGGLLGMVAQALFGGPTSSPGLAGMAAGPSAGTGMGIGGGTGMGMGSFGGGFGFGGGMGDPSDSRSTNRA